jgi:hypothetical protein
VKIVVLGLPSEVVIGPVLVATILPVDSTEPVGVSMSTVPGAPEAVAGMKTVLVAVPATPV